MPPNCRFDPADLAVCKSVLARGSKSFRAASLLLPRPVRRDAAIFYAFCRVADDAIDEAPLGAQGRALEALHRRLDAVFRDSPADDPVDRALAILVREHALPRVPFDALLEGFAWDVERRRYDSLSELKDYAARVAGTVGVVMTHLMGGEGESTLARACDLGVAMQLTNIARDVGADARMGRVYLPLSWLEELRVDVEAFLRAPSPTPQVRATTRRLIFEAVPLYERARRGIGELPPNCRVAIEAARRIYSAIHREIEQAGYDTVSARRSVSGWRKVVLVASAMFSSFERGPALPPLPEVRFLVDGRTERGTP